MGEHGPWFVSYLVSPEEPSPSEPLDSMDTYAKTCPVNSNPDLSRVFRAGVKKFSLTAYFMKKFLGEACIFYPEIWKGRTL